jgi:hypothetical protein
MHLSRTLRGIAGALVVVAATLAGASPASAATSVTVTPSTDLAGYQAVEVQGSGFEPGAQVAAGQCVVGHTTTEDCANIAFGPTADADGNVVFSFWVYRNIYTTNQGQVDCTGPGACVVAIAAISDIDGTVTRAPISFAPAPPAPELTVTINSTGTLDTRTGVATIGGTVTCNTPLDTWVNAQITQRAGRVLVQASGWATATCDATGTWSVQLQSYNGILAGGPVTAAFQIGGCNESGCDYHSGLAQVTLQGRRR